MQTELTPTIAEMIDVIDKYMGKRVSGNPYLYTFNDKGEKCYIEALFDWNSLHSVWEKVSTEEVDGMNNYWHQIELALCGNEKEETLLALYCAIIYINN